MNIRKSLVLITLLTCTYSMSAEVVIDDPIIPGKEKTTGKPRTSTPSVEVSASGDELTVDINRYLGNVQVTVCALDGSSTTSNTYVCAAAPASVERHSSLPGFNDKLSSFKLFFALSTLYSCGI